MTRKKAEAVLTVAKLEEPTDSLALISMAHRALAEAVTLGDFRAIRDTAETLRAGARARGMGIESENLAAEIVVRAERGMGGMDLDLPTTGGARIFDPSQTDRGQGALRGSEPSDRSLAVLLGMTDAGASSAMRRWRILARLTDEQFEAVVDRAKAPREDGTVRRIARVEFAEEVERLYPPEGPARTRVITPRRTGSVPVVVPGQTEAFDRDGIRFASDEAAIPADLDGSDPQVARYAWQSWDRIVNNADAVQTLLDNGWVPDGRPSQAIHAEVRAVGKLLLVMQRLAGPVE
jgi:hypothetical protein